MRLNKRQKELLIQSLAKEYKDVSDKLFAMSMYNRKDKTGSYNERWKSWYKRKMIL